MGSVRFRNRTLIIPTLNSTQVIRQHFVTPTDSYSAVLRDSILSNDQGGLQAEWQNGTHCIPACRDDFGIFGELGLLWWQIFLLGMDKCDELEAILGSGEWAVQYSDNFICNDP